MESRIFDDSLELPIVFFDGVCNLCNASVLFFLDRNRKENLRFASLQSSIAEKILEKKTEWNDPPSSVLFLENGILYRKSTAIIKICAHLTFPWNLFSLFRWIPSFVRDFAYDWIARNRYRWFGRLDSCRIPDPSLKSRFLGE
ncbi:thiol-disulfide oxidoreductase DCC family protein [Leptospira santarosai]|uniref:thiol-disulfide oxidoreductase DCC family protein n=1 Tax=Leptospira santarosai TaxID=28183 RepID=UPI0024AF1AB9|nr:DCC1-like thiol-disulfide oxidoreductase family protein [Leptospira santarosai]MDI7172784.1 DCC1-like thiol-disulfide oxidoreductase family protein [Leptospira santarosai]MDI7192212.1 DCC1-like thiol-disulfide oxidoreductase family protein [Leptospira santarosai]MDO6396835.1 DCC1-like thiol-disulfide oxidoreductase family protein [Leptospira santarosai]MDO6402052.1 DCC1-like thiol-disulfide oxidoreductase family protein [Leptospira santarosai]